MHYEFRRAIEYEIHALKLERRRQVGIVYGLQKVLAEFIIGNYDGIDFIYGKIIILPRTARHNVVALAAILNSFQ